YRKLRALREAPPLRPKERSEGDGAAEPGGGLGNRDGHEVKLGGQVNQAIAGGQIEDGIKLADVRGVGSKDIGAGSISHATEVKHVTKRVAQVQRAADGELVTGGAA